MPYAGAATPGRLMLAEMLEQPARVSAAFAAVQARARTLGMLVPDARQVVLFGRGSSRSAATYAAQALRSFAHVPAYTVSPAQVAWSGERQDWTGSLAVAVSQAGESTEIVAAARAVLASGGDILVVTNAPDSTLARLAPADRTVFFDAGVEVAVPATKTFTACLAALLGIAIAHRPDLLREAATGIPDLMAAVLADPAAVFEVGRATNMVCAGEGYAEAVGEEAAIKFRETLRLPVASFETSEFLHGSINSVDSSTTVVLSSADAVGRHLCEEAVHGAAERGAFTVSIGSGSGGSSGRHVQIPEVPAHWSPFLAILPIQRAAHDTAVLRGLDPDTPLGLSKITRVQEMSSP